MSYNTFEDVSIDNPLPCKEVSGTYTRGEDVSEDNPWPVMVVDLDAYTKFEDVSEDNPQPIALDTGDTYTKFENLSDTNRKPVVLVVGQSYDPKQDVSMTNPWPVIDASPAPSYVGPLDLVPGVLAAYSSARALSAAMCGQDGYTLYNGSDTQAFAYDAATGLIDSAAINTFIGAGEGHCSVFNDASGNARNLLQATDANRIVWNATAGGASIPGFIGGFGQKEACNSFSSFPGGAATVVLVLKTTESPDDSANFIQVQIDGGTEDLRIGQYYNTANKIYITQAGETTIWETSASITTAVHLLEVQFAANGNVVVLLDGNNMSASLVSGSALPLITGDVVISLPANAFGSISNIVMEAYFWPQQDMGAEARTNIADFYGITL